MFKFNSLSKQLSFGYSLILLMFIIFLTITLNQLSRVKLSNNKVEYLVNPTVESSLRLLNGINHSLAALRGWVIIGNEDGGSRFIQERQYAWDEEINKSINQLNILSADWSNTEDSSYLNVIKKSLIKFETYQIEIEKIANTERNIAASEILFKEALPRADTLINEISNIIDIEKTLESSPERKRMFGILADVRGSLSACIANIKAFILSGGEQYRIDFENNWTLNEQHFLTLSLNKSMLNSEQLVAYDKFEIVRTEFLYLPEKMFTSRGAEDWNQANYLIKIHAMPLAFEIKSQIERIIDNNKSKQVEEYDKVREQISYLKWLLIILIGTGFVISIYVGGKFIRSIKTSLEDVISNIKRVTKGELKLDFKESKLDEVNQLSGSVKSLTNEIIKRNVLIETEANKLAEENWIKTSLASILQRLQGYVSLNALADDLLNNLVPKVDGLVGVFYIKQINVNNKLENSYIGKNNLNDKAVLSLIGSYAYLTNSPNEIKPIHLGEGLIGQCALTQKAMYISKVPVEEISINSTFLNTTAKYIALLPISFEGKTLGVIEIGALQEYSSVHKYLLEQVIHNIGVILKTVLGRIETEELLKFLNTQNIELNEHAKNLIEAKKQADLANKDLAAQKTAMDQHSLVSVTDIKGDITYANDKFCAVSGYSREELIGKNHRILNSNQQPKDYWHNMFMKVSQGEYWHDEVCNRAKDGHFYWVDTTIVPLYDIENKLSGFTSIRTDITQQKEIISSLAEAKKQADKSNKDLAAQKTAMDQHSLVSVTDIKGDITYANDKFCAVSGYSREELIGKNHRILNSNQQPKDYWHNMFMKVSQGEYWHDEVCNRAKDGHFYWVDTTIVPLYDIENKLSGFTSIRTDITQQKEIISSLAEAKKQADVANESKTQFLANMSHEIRTPINGVIGMTELLLDTPLDIEQYNFAKVVKNSSESLITIINDILDFSKVEAGKMELELIEFDLAQLIYDVGSSLAIKAEEKGIELICPGILIEQHYVIADSGRIRQILNNLIGNAIKFTEQGEISVDCKLLERNETSTRFLFEVSDTGMGISDEQQTNLFERFTQADESTTRKYGGTGLGLSISKQLVELMGGEIGVRSNLDKGSTFWFSFNLSNAENNLLTYAYEHLDGVKVLIADRNQTSRSLLGQLLKRWKVEYSLVEGSEEALKELLSAAKIDKPYQIAIVDMKMPVMGGVELGYEIKKDHRISNVNLVMLITQGQQRDIKNFMEAGFYGYLNKPINQSTLYNLLVTSCSVDNKNMITADKTKILPQYNARALVVEDNVINQKVAVGLLHKFGIKTFVAANGVEALNTLETILVDLVFMDCQMPVMDGLEATKQIRDPSSKVLNHNVPIIALTANALDGDREKCIEAGMNDFLSKPIAVKRLQVLLKNRLGAN